MDVELRLSESLNLKEFRENVFNLKKEIFQGPSVLSFVKHANQDETAGESSFHVPLKDLWEMRF